LRQKENMVGGIVGGGKGWCEMWVRNVGRDGWGGGGLFVSSGGGGGERDIHG